MARYYTDPNTGQRVEIKKTHKFRNFVVLPAVGLIAIVIGVTAANGGSSTGGQAPGNGPAPVADAGSGHTVVYEVTGSGSGMVTYVTDGNMSMAQETGASLPWSKEITMDAMFAPVSMNVQHSSGSGPITCTITVDGKVISENTAQGAYAIASCNGTL